MIDVKIIQRSSHSALVEWLDNGKLRRVTIPTNIIFDGQVNLCELEMGIPYGIDWSQIRLRASADKLEDELHRVEIWTAEDALSNAPGVVGALLATYAVDMSTIMKIAKQERS